MHPRRACVLAVFFCAALLAAWPVLLPTGHYEPDDQSTDHDDDTPSCRSSTRPAESQCRDQPLSPAPPVIEQLGEFNDALAPFEDNTNARQVRDQFTLAVAAT